MTTKKPAEMKQYELIETMPEFPDSYELFQEIKSPLNMLWYNLVYLFEDDYPAKMNPDFARDMIQMYSKEGDLVWDGCGGAGTVPIMAGQLNRLGFYSDVNPKAMELAKKHAINKRVDELVNFRLGDAREISLPSKVDLILSSFPFGLNIAGDKNNYSDEPKDISNSNSYEKFFEATAKIIQNYYNNLKPKGIMILDARDRTKDGVYHPLIMRFWQQAIMTGFKTLAVYHFLLIPYRQMPHKDADTRMIQPMVSTMDAIVMYKPADQTLGDFSV